MGYFTKNYHYIETKIVSLPVQIRKSRFCKYSIRIKSPNQAELDRKVRDRTTASLTLIGLFMEPNSDNCSRPETILPYMKSVKC